MLQLRSVPSLAEILELVNTPVCGCGCNACWNDWHDLCEATQPCQHLMATAVQRIVQQMNMKPREINYGNCDKFADKLVATLGQQAAFLETDWDASEVPPHCWVQYRGLHFDAETPYGVIDPLDLPIFKRAKAKRKHLRLVILTVPPEQPSSTWAHNHGLT